VRTRVKSWVRDYKVNEAANELWMGAASSNYNVVYMKVNRGVPRVVDPVVHVQVWAQIKEQLREDADI